MIIMIMNYSSVIIFLNEYNLHIVYIELEVSFIVYAILLYIISIQKKYEWVIVKPITITMIGF